MKNNLILSLGSSSLFLLRRNVTEGGEDISEQELEKKEKERNKRSMREGKRREEGERKEGGDLDVLDALQEKEEKKRGEGRGGSERT